MRALWIAVAAFVLLAPPARAATVTFVPGSCAGYVCSNDETTYRAEPGEVNAVRVEQDVGFDLISGDDRLAGTGPLDGGPGDDVLTGGDDGVHFATGPGRDTVTGGAGGRTVRRRFRVADERTRRIAFPLAARGRELEIRLRYRVPGDRVTIRWRLRAVRAARAAPG